MDTVTNRKPPRAMLALVALATDLPLPQDVRFSVDERHAHHSLTLSFEAIADAVPWVERLGGTTQPHEYQGTRYLGYRAGSDLWHGWEVTLHAAEDAEQVDEIGDERAALTELAGALR